MQLRIRIGGKKEEALNRLRHLDGFGETEVTAEEKGETEFRTSLERGTDSGAALDRAFRTLAASGLPVRMMTEEKEGLEEVFLRVISGQ